MFITMEKSASIVYEYTLVLKKEKPKKKKRKRLRIEAPSSLMINKDICMWLPLATLF